MTDAERLCFAADLQMALAPLAGQPLDLLMEIDVRLRVSAVLNKYIRQALRTERIDEQGLHLSVDTGFVAVACETIERFRETLQ